MDSSEERHVPAPEEENYPQHISGWSRKQRIEENLLTKQVLDQPSQQKGAQHSSFSFIFSIMRINTGLWKAAHLEQQFQGEICLHEWLTAALINKGSRTSAES